MQKIAKGELEERIDAMRQRLLTAIDAAPEEILTADATVAGHSVAQILGYLGVWGETVNKGLREIQRRKKPMDLLRAIEKHDSFMRDAIAECEHDILEDLMIRLEDAQIQMEQRLAQYSHDDLNRPKRIRFLGNKPLWPFIASVTYEHEARYVPEIEAYIKRVTGE